eukprot:jgi/Botrbrau1/5885/Bobra.0366s0063.1
MSKKNSSEHNALSSKSYQKAMAAVPILKQRRRPLCIYVLYRIARTAWFAHLKEKAQMNKTRESNSWSEEMGHNSWYETPCGSRTGIGLGMLGALWGRPAKHLKRQSGTSDILQHLQGPFYGRHPRLIQRKGQSSSRVPREKKGGGACKGNLRGWTTC